MIDAYVHSFEYTFCEYLHALQNRGPNHPSLLGLRFDSGNRCVVRLLRAGLLDGSVHERARSVGHCVCSSA